MPFSSLIHAISQIDTQFIFAACVWVSAVFLAGFAFTKCLSEAE